MTTTKSTQELMQHTRDAKENASRLWSSLCNAADIASRAAREQLQERPYVTLGVAAGAGFVIAGGLASRAARTMVKAGGLAVVAALVDDLVDRVKATVPDDAYAPGRQGPGSDEPNIEGVAGPSAPGAPAPGVYSDQERSYASFVQPSGPQSGAGMVPQGPPPPAAEGIPPAPKGGPQQQQTRSDEREESGLGRVAPTVTPTP